MPALPPKPPPTLGMETRTLFSGSLNVWQNRSRTVNGDCALVQMLDPVAGLPLGDGDVGLHRHVLHRGVGVLALDDPGRFGEALVDVALAAAGEVGDVGAGLRREYRLDVVVLAEIGVDQRRARRERVHVIEDRRQGS